MSPILIIGSSILDNKNEYPPVYHSSEHLEAGTPSAHHSFHDNCRRYVIKAKNLSGGKFPTLQLLKFDFTGIMVFLDHNHCSTHFYLRCLRCILV
jgi:hypothetical protein